MVYYSYELDRLVQNSDYVPYKVKQYAKHKPGHDYWCAYWQQGYTVLDVGERGVVHIRWFNGKEVYHQTSLNQRDYELKHHSNLKPIVGESYTFAEIKAMQVKCPEFADDIHKLLTGCKQTLKEDRYYILKYNKKRQSIYLKRDEERSPRRKDKR